jgi:PAS domain S-box-containing protein
MGQVQSLQLQGNAGAAIHVHPAGIGGVNQDEFDFRDFFENGAMSLHLVGRDGTILHANKAELDFLGYSAEEYIGRPITEFHADPEVIADILARLTRGEKLEKYPARLRARDGSMKRRNHVQRPVSRRGVHQCPLLHGRCD